MSLPKLSIPTFDIVIPSTKETHKFRPFLVKEEKLLLITLESIKQNQDTKIVLKEINEVLKNIIKSCNLSDLKVENLASFDIEYIFLQLRSKSVNEMTTIIWNNPDCKNEDKTIRDTCSKKIQLNLATIEVEFDKDHNKKIMLTDSIGMIMKYPTNDTFVKLASMDENTFEFMLKLIENCIESIFDDKDVYPISNYKPKEILDFIESLSTEQLEKVSQFFATIPKLKKEMKTKCDKCGVELDIKLEGLHDFFS